MSPAFDSAAEQRPASPLNTALTAGRVEERYVINSTGQLEVHSVMQARAGRPSVCAGCEAE